MKVLVFPALLAIAIITTPPKPFAQAPASKPLTAAPAPKPAPTPLTTARHQSPAEAGAPTLTSDPSVTARR